MADKNDDLKNLTLKLIIDTMPDEIKAAGGCTDPKGVEVAMKFAEAAGKDVMGKLFLLLISQPDAQHEVTMKFPSLNDAMRMAGLEPFKSDAKGEAIKDGADAPAPTQRSAKA